ncbi:MAG: polysaccharide deacetylase family protein [Rhodospirillaceae bacterium]|nr:polysaccharide deacetylase family protein [Rhodospirillaceae bacterium]
MTDRPDANRPTSTWRDLTAELDRWQKAGRKATFWWRDDDVEAPGRRLDRLLDLSESVAAKPLPLALAVIPAGADPALADRLRGLRHVSVLQHGWSHANHAPEGERTIELGSHRPARAVLRELDTGRERMGRLFRGRFVPVIVPPWNRIAPTIARALPRHDYIGLSSSGARGRQRRAGRFAVANVHIDIFEWHPRARFAGTGPVIDQAIRHLAARREGRVDPDEPTGFMTHHLQHDAACWRFVERFLRQSAAHPAVRWLPASRVFAATGRPQ